MQIFLHYYMGLAYSRVYRVEGIVSKHLTEDLVDNRDTHASVVGLNVGLLDLAILNDQGVTLAAVVAEDGGGIEIEVESLGELAVGVGKEADTALLVSVKIVGPCLHDKGVVDRDDEDITGILELLVVDVTGNVGFGARRTESSRDTNDKTLALEDLGDGDLVAGRVLHQLNVRNRVADLNHDGRCCVE